MCARAPYAASSASTDDHRRYRSVGNHKRTLATSKGAVPAVLARPCAAITDHRTAIAPRLVACNGGASACEDGGYGSFCGLQSALMVHYASVAPGIVHRGQYGHVGRSVGGRRFADLSLLFSYKAKISKVKKVPTGQNRDMGGRFPPPPVLGPPSIWSKGPPQPPFS